MGNILGIHSRGGYRMKRRYGYIVIILIMCILSACHNTKGESASTSVNNTSTTTEASNDISDDIRELLKLGEYDDIEIKGDKRDAVSIVKNNQRFLFPECRVLSVTYTTFSEGATFLSLNKKEVLELINLIEESSILKDGDSLSNYGVKDDTQEKYAKICIVYKNSRGEVQNVWLNTFKGDVYHIKAGVGEYSENDIAIEGACYEGTENVIRLLEK